MRRDLGTGHPHGIASAVRSYGNMATAV